MRRRSPAAHSSVPPSWLVLASGALVSWLAGCYSASSLQEGAPCQRTEQCPEPQVCALGSWSVREPAPADARPATPPDAAADGATGAATDAAIDAMPPACSTVGLSCTGGTAGRVGGAGAYWCD